MAQSTPAEVNLVMIGGDVAYIREDWLEGLGAEDHEDHLEPLWAWGKRMVLDTSYVAGAEEAQPRLAEIRASLIAAYPNIGPCSRDSEYHTQQVCTAACERTTSNAEPGIPLSWLRFSSSQPRVRAAAEEPVRAVVGDDHPVALQRLRRSPGAPPVKPERS